MARLTEALATPGSRLSDRSMRVAQALQCIPPSSSSVVLEPGVVVAGAGAATGDEVTMEGSPRARLHR